MKQLGLILLLLLSLPAAAAEWVRARPLADGDQYFYDRSKIYINGDEITYWKKVAFKTPVTVKGHAATSGIYRERIHCAEHTLRLISYLLYAADGSTIEYIASHEAEATPIIPDTVGDVFEKTVCDLVRLKQVQAQQSSGEAGKDESGKKTPAPPILTPGATTPPMGKPGQGDEKIAPVVN